MGRASANPRSASEAHASQTKGRPTMPITTRASTHTSAGARSARPQLNILCQVPCNS